MPAYILVDVNITDPDEYEEYRKLTPATIAAFGGKFIVRGGVTEILEGDWNTGRFVVIEFPSAEQAKAWWESPEYTAAKAIRYRAASSKMILVEGV